MERLRVRAQTETLLLGFTNLFAAAVVHKRVHSYDPQAELWLLPLTMIATTIATFALDTPPSQLRSSTRQAKPPTQPKWSRSWKVKPRPSARDLTGLGTATLLPTLIVASSLVVRDGRFLRDGLWATLATSMWTLAFVATGGKTAATEWRAIGSGLALGVVAQALNLYSIGPTQAQYVQLVDLVRDVVVVGMTGVSVRAVMQKWTRCLTLGEAVLLVGSGAAIVRHAVWMTQTRHKGHPPETVALVAVLLVLILSAVVLSPLALKVASRNQGPAPQNKASSVTIPFYVLAVALVMCIVYPWMRILMPKHEPAIWFLENTVLEPSRQRLCVGWISMLLVPVFVLPPQSLPLPQIIARKSYHILAVIMFTPAFLADPGFLALAQSVALLVLFLVELLRQGHVWPANNPRLDEFMTALLDHRDTGVLVLTHLYLLLGCAASSWFGVLQPGLKPYMSRAAGLAGVAVLGIGDTVASAVGSKLGRIRWRGTQKTVEGTLAGWLCMVAFYRVVLGVGTRAQWIIICMSSLLVSLLEAYTSQIDNLILTPYLYALYGLTTGAARAFFSP